MVEVVVDWLDGRRAGGRVVVSSRSVGGIESEKKEEKREEEHPPVLITVQGPAILYLTAESLSGRGGRGDLRMLKEDGWGRRVAEQGGGE